MRERLNIAFYTDSFLPAVDGVVTSTLNFKKELERRGHHVHIFASGTERTKRAIEDQYDNVHIFRSIRFKRYPQYSLALFPFAASLQSKEMDLIHAQTPFTMGHAALFSARINRVPFVSTFHTLFTDKSVIKEYTSSNKFAQRMLTRYSWDFVRFFYNKADAVISPSSVISRILEKEKVNNVWTIPNGIDTERFNPSVSGARVRKELGLKRSDKVVLYLGRISNEKRLEVMIKAAAALKGRGIRFVIGGTGPARHRCREMAHRMGLSGTVIFTGFIDPEKVPGYYAAADLFCIPSTFETQGMVAAEAMATRKPVVGADRLALSELIENGVNGEKFAVGDWKDCARKIEKVINNIDSYKGMIPTAKRFSLENTTNELLVLYHDLIRNKS